MSASAFRDFDELAERTLQLAIVARALEDRSDRATRAVEQAARDMSAAAAHLTSLGEQIGRDATQAVARDAAGHVREAVATSIANAGTALDACTGRMRELERALREGTAALARGHRRWLSIAPALLLMGCGIAVAGTVAWVAKARSDVARHRAEAATLQALGRSDVVRCGDALCVRLAPGGAQADGYRRVAERAATR